MVKKSPILIDVLVDTDEEFSLEDESKKIESFWIILQVPIYPIIGAEFAFQLPDLDDNWEILREYEDRPTTQEQYDYMLGQSFVFKRLVFENDGRITYWAKRRLKV